MSSWKFKDHSYHEIGRHPLAPPMGWLDQQAERAWMFGDIRTTTERGARDEDKRNSASHANGNFPIEQASGRLGVENHLETSGGEMIIKKQQDMIGGLGESAGHDENRLN